MNFLRILFFSCFTCLLVVPVQAYYPKAEVDIRNTKIPNRRANELDNLWLAYLKEHPENIKPAGKKYSIDQFCRYTVNLTENGNLAYDTLKLVKQKRENPSYNLGAIDFIRSQNLKLKKKKSGEPLTINFKYYAF